MGILLWQTAITSIKHRRVLMSENFPLLVGLITLWSLIFSKDFILLVVYYIVVADQDVIVDNKSAMQARSAITQRVPKQLPKVNREENQQNNDQQCLFKSLHI